MTSLLDHKPPKIWSFPIKTEVKRVQFQYITQLEICPHSVVHFYDRCFNQRTLLHVYPKVLVRILRLGKLARAQRVVTMSNTLASLELLTKCLQSSIDAGVADSGQVAHGGQVA